MDREPPYLVFDHVIRSADTGTVVTRGTIKTLLVDHDRIPHDIPDFFMSGS
jgi:acyl-CoA thioesterase FadM